LWLEYIIIQKPINPSVPPSGTDVNLKNNEKKVLLIYPFDNHGRVSILPEQFIRNVCKKDGC
jgi:hypothetical protein